MSVFEEFMRMIEERPEVKKIKEHLARLEEQIKQQVTEESWGVFLDWEEHWAQYALIMSRAMFPYAYQQGWQAHDGVERLEGERVPYKAIRTTILCHDECMICDGVQITNTLALVRVKEEQHLLFCNIEEIPGTEVYRVRRPSHALMQQGDHLFPLIGADMNNLTFAQFAQKYEGLLAQALLDD